MATLPVLTTARRSLWQAIDAWPALKQSPDDPTATLFAMRFDFEDEPATFSEIVPSLSDLPCIAIAPAVVDPTWYLNRMQNWQVRFQVTIWVNEWTLPQLERLIETVSDAFFQAIPDDGSGSTVPIVKGAVGFYPEIGPFAIAPVRVGEENRTQATRVQMTVTLRNNKDPLTATLS